MGRAVVPGWVRIAIVLILCGLVQISVVRAIGPAAMRFGAQRWPDASGFVGSWSPRGVIATSNPFYQPLGTNGQACVTCHQPRDGWSITPTYAYARFVATGGLDPLFRPNDGATSPRADFSTVAARLQAYYLLLSRGLIRVGLGIPANAQFRLVSVRDPYGYASAWKLSLFRRPLPTTNLSFLSSVMWDGRETARPITTGTSRALQADLAQLVRDVATGPEQAAHAPGARRTQQIVSFELGLFTAQTSDTVAGDLASAGALGGPQRLYRQPFYVGINDPLGHSPTATRFTPRAFTLYGAWARGGGGRGRQRAARSAIARGEALFNTRRFIITGVAGLNDVFGLPTIMGTCSTCHDAPNVGSRSVDAPLNIGTAGYPARPGLNLSDLPVYRLLCPATGIITQTTDPGRALVSGRCRDIGKFKVPILRGLAARPPYFHNGSAATLDDVMTFYNKRFDIGLTARESADLVAFLRSL
jgi:hypothetical protein